MKHLSDNKGFTMIELMVVTSIIILLTAFALPNYRVGDQQLALQRSAHKLSQDLRRAQEMTMSAEFSDKTSGVVPSGGYGIRFQKEIDSSKYLLFGDADDDHQYGAGDYSIEEITIEGGVIINAIETDKGSKNNLFIAFVPPEAEAFFVPAEDISWARITMAHEEDATLTRTVFVNIAGLIAIE